MAKHTKIAIIGAGMVGACAAYSLILKNICSEILVVDLDEKHLDAEVMDLNDSLSFSDVSVIKSGSLKEAADADIIVITAGVSQKPGETRIDLLARNRKVFDDIFKELKPINDAAIILVVSNPVDLMTLYAQEVSGLPRHQVFGSGTFLDSQRLRNMVAGRLNIADSSIHAYILGEHGDSQFPAWSISNITGMPLTDFPGIDEKFLKDCAEGVKQKAYKIIAGKRATYYGISACVAAICEDVLFNTRRTLPLSVYLEQYKVCLSVPVVLGEHGIESQLPLNLEAHEIQQLEACVDQIKEFLN